MFIMLRWRCFNRTVRWEILTSWGIVKNRCNNIDCSKIRLKVGLLCYGMFVCVSPLFDMYNVPCTLYIVHYTFCFVYCTLYSVHFALYNVQSTFCFVHYTLYSVHCTLYIVQCTLYNVQCTTSGIDCGAIISGY